MIFKKTKKNEIEQKEKSWVLDTLKKVSCLAIYTIALFILTRMVFMIAYVPSSSMEDTLQIGDIMIGNRLNKEYKRGDIVVFQSQEDDLYVKRLIGEPGDEIVIKDNQVYINGEKAKEPYLKEKMDTEDVVFNVPKGEYLFLGDNRNDSRDARFWDYPYIKRDKLRAKVVFRFWPINKICIFSNTK